MMAGMTESKVVSASRDIAAPAAALFELIADPAQQPRWDGNDNLSEAPAGQRVHAVGDVFSMTLTQQAVRENHVVEFEEGRLIAWMPAEPGGAPIGQLWRWQLEPLDRATRTPASRTPMTGRSSTTRNASSARAARPRSHWAARWPGWRTSPRRTFRRESPSRSRHYVDFGDRSCWPGIVTGLR